MRVDLEEIPFMDPNIFDVIEKQARVIRKTCSNEFRDEISFWMLTSFFFMRASYWYADLNAEEILSMSADGFMVQDA